MFKDVEISNENYFNKPFAYTDFTQSEFKDCEFEDCGFTKADFLGAIFVGCDFFRCDLDMAYLTGVRFEHCRFIECSFNEAYIFRSQFKNCEITLCTMRDAMLSTVDFPGTDFDSVSWNGTSINSAPLIIDGIEYPIVALDNGYMHVGCEFNTMDWFYTTEEQYSARMEGLRARRFWKQNKKWIFDMLVARKLYVYPENFMKEHY